MLEYQNIIFFAKDYVPNWLEQLFGIKKFKNKAPQTYVISDLTAEEIVGTLYEKELQTVSQKEF